MKRVLFKLLRRARYSTLNLAFFRHQSRSMRQLTKLWRALSGPCSSRVGGGCVAAAIGSRGWRVPGLGDRRSVRET